MQCALQPFLLLLNPHLSQRGLQLLLFPPAVLQTRRRACSREERQVEVAMQPGAYVIVCESLFSCWLLGPSSGLGPGLALTETRKLFLDLPGTWPTHMQQDNHTK